MSTSDKRIRHHLLTEEHGSSAEQDRAIRQKILAAFREPARWPMTDTERVELLRGLYNQAVWAEQTELSKP